MIGMNWSTVILLAVFGVAVLLYMILGWPRPTPESKQATLIPAEEPPKMVECGSCGAMTDVTDGKVCGYSSVSFGKRCLVPVCAKCEWEIKFCKSCAEKCLTAA